MLNPTQTRADSHNQELQIPHHYCLAGGVSLVIVFLGEQWKNAQLELFCQAYKKKEQKPMVWQKCALMSCNELPDSRCCITETMCLMLGFIVFLFDKNIYALEGKCFVFLDLSCSAPECVGGKTWLAKASSRQTHCRAAHMACQSHLLKIQLFSKLHTPVSNCCRLSLCRM